MGQLDDWIREYLDDDEVSLTPHDHEAEIRNNTWTYGVADARPTRDELVDALLYVVRGLRERFQDAGVPGRFYAWYDEGSGQLRCSVTSRDDLPFHGGNVRATDSLDEVLAILLGDESPGVIRASELSERRWTDDGDDDDVVPPQTPVWVATVSQPSADNRTV